MKVRGRASKRKRSGELTMRGERTEAELSSCAVSREKSSLNVG